jgi:hypothetical protein
MSCLEKRPSIVSAVIKAMMGMKLSCMSRAKMDDSMSEVAMLRIRITPTAIALIIYTLQSRLTQWYHLSRLFKRDAIKLALA